MELNPDSEHPRADPRTHIIAVYSSIYSSSVAGNTKLFPPHELVFGAHCANLPPFYRTRNLHQKIPVDICCAIPPSAALLEYLYTKSTHVLGLEHQSPWNYLVEVGIRSEMLHYAGNNPLPRFQLLAAWEEAC